MPELLKVENFVKESNDPRDDPVPGFITTHKINGVSSSGVKGRITGRLISKYPLKAGKIETLTVRPVESGGGDNIQDDMEKIKQMRERREQRKEKSKSTSEVKGQAGRPRPTNIGKTFIVETFIPNKSLGDGATQVIEDLVQRAQETNLG